MLPKLELHRGLFDGELVRRQGRHHEEVEDEQEEEVERRMKREHSSNHNTSAHAWMTWNEPQVRCMNACTTTHLNAAHCAQWCADVM